jgi:hypothetical protein
VAMGVSLEPSDFDECQPDAVAVGATSAASKTLARARQSARHSQDAPTLSRGRKDVVVQSRDSSTPSEGQKNGGHPTHLAFRAIALHTTCAITPRPSPMRATSDSKPGLSWSLYSLHSQQTSSCAHSLNLHSQPCPHATTADDHRHYHSCRIAQLELELHRTRAEAEASRGDFELLREVVSD